jgi:hypothetical protein
MWLGYGVSVLDARPAGIEEILKFIGQVRR